jgi:hypothetical protein
VIRPKRTAWTTVCSIACWARRSHESAVYPSGRDGAEMPTLRDEDIDRVRALRAEVLGKWAATPAGETLELTFTRSPALPDRMITEEEHIARGTSREFGARRSSR